METSEIDTGNEFDRILSSKISDDVFVFHVLRFVPVWDLTRSVQLVNKATANCVWISLEQSNIYDWRIFLKKNYMFQRDFLREGLNEMALGLDTICIMDRKFCFLKGGKITCSLHLFHKLIKIGAVNLKKCGKGILFMFIVEQREISKPFFVDVIECLLTLTEEPLDGFKDLKKSIFHRIIFENDWVKNDLESDEILVSLFYRFPKKLFLPSREFIFDYFLKSQKRISTHVRIVLPNYFFPPDFHLVVLILIHQNGMYPNLCQELFQYAIEDFGDLYLNFFLEKYFSASEEFRKHEKIYPTIEMIEKCLHNGYKIEEDDDLSIDDMDAFINTMKCILRYLDKIGLWEEYGKNQYQPVFLKKNELVLLKKRLEETIKVSRDIYNVWLSFEVPGLDDLDGNGPSTHSVWNNKWIWGLEMSLLQMFVEVKLKKIRERMMKK